VIDRPYACDECDNRYKSAAALKDHKTIHTGELNYVCVNCPERFRASRELRVHKRFHTGKQSGYVCTVCDNQFIQARSLCIYSSILSDKLDFSCDECDKKFYGPEQLLGHKRHHASLSCRHVCMQCDEKFGQRGATLSQENVIVKIVFGQLLCHKKYYCHARICCCHVCMQCDKTFRLKGDLLRHTHSAHGGERSFTCSKYSKIFVTLNNLKSKLKKNVEKLINKYIYIYF